MPRPSSVMSTRAWRSSAGHVRGDATGAVAHRVREQDVEHLTDRAERRQHRHGLGRDDHDAAAAAREDRLDVVDVLAHEVAEIEAA